MAETEKPRMKMNPHEWGASLRQNGARICNPQRQRNPPDVADCKSAPGRIRVPSCPFVVEQSRFPPSVMARAHPPPVPNVTPSIVTFVTIHKPTAHRLQPALNVPAANSRASPRAKACHRQAPRPIPAGRSSPGNSINRVGNLLVRAAPRGADGPLPLQARSTRICSDPIEFNLRATKAANGASPMKAMRRDKPRRPQRREPPLATRHQLFKIPIHQDQGTT